MSWASKDKVILNPRSTMEKPFSVEVRRNDSHDDGGPLVDVIVEFRCGGKKIVRHLERGPKLNAIYNTGFENKILQAIEDAE